MHQPYTPRQSQLAIPLRLRRRGSILIFVVAMLTLLALIGTAFVATTRIDRYAAPSDSTNPGELANDLLNGVKTTVVNAIRDDVYNNGVNATAGATQNYRPGILTTAATDTSRYEHWDSGLSDLNDPLNTTKQADGWLGERIPVPWDPTAALSTTNPPIWRVVSRPLNGDTNYTFESPYYQLLYYNAASYTKPYYTLRHDQTVAVPASQTITYTTVTSDANYDASLAGKTRVFPAFHLYSIAAGALTVVNDSTGTPAGFIAGDADGDGIADCGLWRLTSVDGVTYYAGVRVIDNNSAININTAWSRDHDYDFSGATLPNFAYFPSNIGLLELFGNISIAPIAGGSEDLQMLATNKDRFNSIKDGSTSPYKTSATPVADGDLFNIPTTDDAPTSRADFTFSSQGESLFSQVSSRLANPGYRVAGTISGPSPTAVQYTPYTNNTADFYLGYHFLMVDPNIKAGTFETSLYTATASIAHDDSVYGGAVNFFPTQGPAVNPGKALFTYLPPSTNSSDLTNNVLYWYNYHFEFDDAVRNTFFTSTLSFSSAPRRSVRPLLVSSNPVSNHTPIHLATSASGNGNVINEGMAPYGTKGRWSAELAYIPGDIVEYYYPGAADHLTHLYVCIANQSPNAAGTQPPTPPAPPTLNASNSYWSIVNPRGIAVTTPAPAYASGDLVRIEAPAVGTNPPTTDLWIADSTSAPTGPPPAAGWFHLSSNINPPKVSLNTAPFAELWRGFWNVMSEPGAVHINDSFGTNYDAYVADVTASNGNTAPPDPYTPPAGTTINWYDPYIGTKFSQANFNSVSGINGLGAPHQLEMFRSSIRDPRAPFSNLAPSNRFRAIDMVQLRSAIAAVNAEALRDKTGTTVPERTIYLDMLYRDGGPAAKFSTTATTLLPVKVNVFGQKPQPFITEVYANNDNVSDYSNSGTGIASNPNGYVAIELYNPYSAPMDINGWVIATVDRRASAGTYPQIGITTFNTIAAALPIPGNGYLIIDNAIAGDATKLPPPVASTTVGAPLYYHVSGLASAVFDRECVLLRPSATATNITDWAPVDSYDFTGFTAAPAAVAGQANCTAWHYARPSYPAGSTLSQIWQCVYPGRYDGSVSAGQPRQQGTDIDSILVNLTTPTNPITTDNWSTSPPAPPSLHFNATNTTASYVQPGNPNNFSIPLCLSTWPSTALANAFPFNSFAYAGDVLQVPFIGSYTIQVVDPANGSTAYPVTTTVMEMNSVSMDSVFAEDTITANDINLEQIGRFCPIIPPAGTVTYPTKPLTYGSYDWAADILDHFTAIQNVNDDFLPNVDPARYATMFSSPNPNGPAPVSNTSGAVPNSYNDQDAPIQGLININTAPWPVLAMAPLVTSTAGVVDVPNTVNLAKAIVAYRNQHGPFRSLFDLNYVYNSASSLVFENAEGTNPTLNDFTTQYLQVMRLSNLLTVRSDSYTIYLLVQGWKNVGTAYPQLITERRSAYTVDRSALNASNTTPTTTSLDSDP
ncbi:MAG TPA: helix-hairpin-helix domain-containing protein [Tepidisphaeraceae bacterium]|nr:helix-hairpin-helix domain-containing protein [Tepidisphaeraceae bacterium]